MNILDVIKSAKEDSAAKFMRRAWSSREPRMFFEVVGGTFYLTRYNDENEEIDTKQHTLRCDDVEANDWERY